jgi:hypothetical protein
MTQNQVIEVQVKKEPYFEVTEVNGSLYPDKGGMLYVTWIRQVNAKINIIDFIFIYRF